MLRKNQEISVLYSPENLVRFMWLEYNPKVLLGEYFHYYVL
jgi:hypothetical protein